MGGGKLGRKENCTQIGDFRLRNWQQELMDAFTERKDIIHMGFKDVTQGAVKSLLMLVLILRCQFNILALRCQINI